ncbi:hypothetical protein L9F63_022305, partial [Diploptera punctata]
SSIQDFTSLKYIHLNASHHHFKVVGLIGNNLLLTQVKSARLEGKCVSASVAKLFHYEPQETPVIHGCRIIHLVNDYNRFTHDLRCTRSGSLTWSPAFPTHFCHQSSFSGPNK